MASIYDFGDPPKPPVMEEDPKRSKKRESLNGSQLRAGKLSLLEMVEAAFETLRNAMREADWPTAIKAAQIVLDRAGHGPKSTVDVNTTHRDLSALTQDELKERALQLYQMIGRERGNPDEKAPTVN